MEVLLLDVYILPDVEDLYYFQHDNCFAYRILYREQQLLVLNTSVNFDVRQDQPRAGIVDVFQLDAKEPSVRRSFDPSLDPLVDLFHGRHPSLRFAGQPDCSGLLSSSLDLDLDLDQDRASSNCGETRSVTQDGSRDDASVSSPA